jgi:hypothetical protein
MYVIYCCFDRILHTVKSSNCIATLQYGKDIVTNTNKFISYEMVEYIVVNNYMFRPPSRPLSGCTITLNKVRPYKTQIQGVRYW